jgi:hypothetical protein
MKFLEEIVETILEKHQASPDSVTIVFPNRRAGLFFRKYLASKISGPIWSPKITSIEDFIKDLSEPQSSERLDLIFELYRVFTQVNHSKEEFDQFYFWGNILLQDFDEVDKFMVDARLLFKNLQHIKQLEGDYDFLDDAQKALIRGFWQSFDQKLSRHQQGFIDIWQNLYETYTRFRTRLGTKGMAYDGMIYREVTEKLQASDIAIDTSIVIFAGFNALSKSEEEIISWFVREGRGEVYWDADDHYLNNNQQEAGKFLRQMKFGNPVLRKSFKRSYGNAFFEEGKSIEVISVASDVGQAQEASAILSNLEGEIDENTAVILPDNGLLFPLLHALPEEVKKLNITMGYPLTASSLYSLLNALIDLRLKSEGRSAYHFRNVLAVLNHPQVASVHDDTLKEIIRHVEKHNILWVPEKMLDPEHPLLSRIFAREVADLPQYLIDIIKFLRQSGEDEVDQEFAFQFYLLLNRLREFLYRNDLKPSIPVFQKLFRQLVQSHRVAFEGEPLLGLQVMGILETRNLDFRNIIVLSVSEGHIPPSPRNTSFIPYSIRKVFGLPVVDQQDAMYSYVFYRMVQRAKNIYFIYNSTEETGKSGEVSRYVRQLEHETKMPVTFRTVSNEVIVEDPNEITIAKDERVKEQLLRFTSERQFQKRYTPTAINTYLDCTLKFYFKYVLELYEQDEMAEEVDPMVFGNILHHIMEDLYEPFDRDGHRTVDEAAIDKIADCVESGIDKEFAKQFGAEVETFQYEGQNILVREIIRKMVLKVLEYNKQQAPFEILGIEADEEKGYAYKVRITSDDINLAVGFKGIIDRIERRDNAIRIVDYKTGRDQKNFASIESLFDREDRSRNKAVMQTFLYALLYLNSSGPMDDLPVQASLFNIRDLFTQDFSPLIEKGKGSQRREVLDIRIYLGEFEERLRKLIEEIYDWQMPFMQTDDLKKCTYCPYRGICNR